MRLPFDLVFVSALLALMFIDAQHWYLPDVITYPGMIFAVVARLAIPFLSGHHTSTTCLRLSTDHSRVGRSGAHHSAAQ